MRASFINNPEHWRERADEMRAIASGMKDPETIATMHRIAEDYDRLAERAAHRASGTPETQQNDGS